MLRHVLSTAQFTKEELEKLFIEASKMQKSIEEKRFLNLMDGKIMATLFFEPSTRTRFSFETAMLRLGGKVVSNADMMSTSSMRKMETLYDTGKTVSQMVDVIVMRHFEPGSVAELAKGSDVPVMNAGDGIGGHPTQGLLDVYTIWKEFGKLDGLRIGFTGDIKNSRVIHSQLEILKQYDCEFVFVSAKELCLDDETRMELKEKNVSFSETENLDDVIGEVDVLSTSRLQKERFANPDDCEKFRGLMTVDKAMLAKAKEKMIVLNPLPRVDEITLDIDSDPRAKHFEQVKNGVAIRMALLKWIFEL